eukprot:6474878-Amphidinium_carterae.2
MSGTGSASALPAQWTLVSAGDHYSQLALRLSAVDPSAEGYAHAAILEVREGGMLLVLPGDAVAEELLSVALAEGLTGVIGPHRKAEGVHLIGARGAPVVQTTTILMLDLPDSVADMLFDASIVDAEVVMPFAQLRNQHRWPSAADVRSQWLAWTQSRADDFTSGRLSGFATPPDHLAAAAAAQPSGRARLPSVAAKRPFTETTTPKAPPARGPHLMDAEAQRSGVSPEQLQQLLRLAGAAPPRLSAAGPQAPQPRVLPDVEAFAEDDEEDYIAPASAQPANPAASSTTDDLMRTVLVALAQRLASHSASDNFLTEESEPRTVGARGCAARAAYIDAMPKKASQHLEAFRRRLAAALDTDVSVLQPGALRQYFHMRSPLGTHKLLTYNAFLVARHWELMEIARQKMLSLPVASQKVVLPAHDQAMFQVALHAIFLDQTAIDN